MNEVTPLHYTGKMWDSETNLDSCLLMKQTRVFSAAFLLAIAAACPVVAQQSSPLPDSPGASVPRPAVPNGPMVIFDTTMGRMTCQFYQAEAPKTVENFIGLATGTKTWTDPTTHKKMVHKPLYNGTIFHRVIPGFMIQGGDPTGTGMGDPGYTFEDEFSPTLTFDVPGRMASANSGPNTNGSQFFITTVPTPHLNNHHTIFGQCDEHSVLVAQSIADVPRNGEDKPDTDVKITKVTIVQPGQPLPPDPSPAPAATPAPAAAPATATPAPTATAPATK